MNIDQLKKQVPDEYSCRKLFEKLIWSNGRFCPHCGCDRSYYLSGRSSRMGLYECAYCKRQFTVTTKTPMHSTKLPLWKWLLVLYYMINSSKGISSTFIARLVGVTQSTAWKMGHAIRKIMETWAANLPELSGTIEMDEKFFGGKPRYQFGVRNKVGKGTKKQSVLIALERKGPVHPVHVDRFNSSTISSIVDKFTDNQANLMTDKSPVFYSIGKQFSSHETVYHLAKEYARGDVHINTTESFGSMLERTKKGVFHYMSPKHLSRYLSELSFSWANRDPKVTTTKTGKKKTLWTPKPFLEQLKSLLPNAHGSQIRRTVNGGIREIGVIKNMLIEAY